MAVDYWLTQVGEVLWRVSLLSKNGFRDPRFFPFTGWCPRRNEKASFEMRDIADFQPLAPLQKREDVVLFVLLPPVNNSLVLAGEKVPTQRR